MNAAGKELLIKAKQIIVERGWVQGDYRRDERVCMLGAMNQAESGDPRHVTLSRAHCSAVHAIAQVTGYCNVALFNDAPGRKVDEVLETFDKAIAYMEASCST